MDIKLFPLSGEYLDEVWQIERQAHSHPWSESMIRDLSSRGACHHVLLCDGQVAGYFYAQNIVGEVTLLNIAVDPALQGKGFGRRLLEGFLEHCQSIGAESAWLEVRAGNAAALGLYHSTGFNEVDRRRGYYPAPNGREDAVVMSCLFL